MSRNYRIKESRFDKQVNEFKAKLILKILKKNGYNISSARRETGLSRITIRKLAEKGLQSGNLKLVKTLDK
jgi:hypothetical protein